MSNGSFGEQLMWVLPFGWLGIVSWGFRIVRKILAASARPVRNGYRTTTILVVSSFHEDPDVLIRCLRTWVRQGPSRITFVLEVAAAEAQRRFFRARHRRLQQGVAGAAFGARAGSERIG